MDVKIQSIKVDIQNIENNRKDVYVDFQYEKTNNDIEFTLKVFVGSDCSQSCRYSMDLVYLLENIKEFNDEEELIEECINNIVPSLSSIIISNDFMIKI